MVSQLNSSLAPMTTNFLHVFETAGTAHSLTLPQHTVSLDDVCGVDTATKSHRVSKKTLCFVNEMFVGMCMSPLSKSCS